MTAPALRDTPIPVKYTYRATLVVGAVLPLVPSFLGQLPRAILAAAALLLIASGCLLVSAARGRDGERPDFTAAAIAAGPGALILVIKLLPALVMLIAAPLTWITSVWSGKPDGLGLAPPWSTYPMEVVFNGEQPIAVAIAALAAGVAAFAMTRRLRTAMWAVALVLPVALPLALVVRDVRWPWVPLSMLVIGTGLVIAAAGETAMTQRVAAGTQGMTFVAAGTGACLATPATTVPALAALTATAVLAAARGRPVVRVIAWIFAVGLGSLAAAAAVLTAGYGRIVAAFGVLGIALAALAVAAAIRSTRRDDALALAGSAHFVMIVATFMTAGSLRSAILLCGIWTAALGARIWWPGVSTVDRRFLAVPAAAWATITWWLVLGPSEDAVYAEPYTLPVAAVALLVGWANRRRQPSTKAWAAYGPAVLLAVLPTLTIAAETNDPWRWLAGGSVIVVGVIVLLWRRRARTATNGA